MLRHVFHSPQGQRIALARGAVFSYTARAGERLRCEGGRVLLSQFKVNEDFDLGRGREVEIRTHGLVVIEAVEATVVSLIRREKDLQQTVEVALAAQRRAHVIRRYLQQLLALGGKQFFLKSRQRQAGTLGKQG